MNKILLPVLLIAALVLVSGCTQGGSKSTPSPTQTATATPSATTTTSPAATPTVTTSATATPSSTTPGKKTIEMTSSGFSPSTVNVKAGDKVTFMNKDTNQHWPASAVHPTHKAYPGSDLAKCQDEVEKTKIFDACKGLAQGESWSFTFAEKGTWKYHDHLNSGSTGTIVVE